VTTAADILNTAGRGLGYLGNTEVMSAADANAGLNVFNAMLDSWNGESLTAYAWQTLNFNLVSGTSVYTIGPTGVWVAQRPTQIYDAFITDANQLNYPLAILTQDKWNNIGMLTITSQIPTAIFYDSQYPNGIINIFPIPLLNYTITLNCELQIANFVNLTTAFSMPPGYLRAYTSNLSLELMANGWPCLLDEKQLTALVNVASTSKGNIKRANIKEVLADYDAAIVSKSYATYNIFSDSNPRS
jgi:hypothetical protein